MQKWQVPVTLACLLTGMFAVNAFRTHSAYENSQTVAKKNNNLVGIINYLEKENKLMENKVEGLRTDINNIQETQALGSKKITKLQDQVVNLKAAAGLSDVKGNGIIISLDDNKEGANAAKNLSPGEYDPQDFIIHDKNLLYLVATLRNAGAQAISINEQRIITTSDIRCVGTVILVNSTRLAPPYTIKAIGDPNNLLAAVQKSDEYVYIQSKNLPMLINKHYNITVPAYNGPLQFVHAQLAKEGK